MGRKAYVFPGVSPSFQCVTCSVALSVRSVTVNSWLLRGLFRYSSCFIALNTGASRCVTVLDPVFCVLLRSDKACAILKEIYKNGARQGSFNVT